MLRVTSILLLVEILSMQMPSTTHAEAIPCNNTFLGMIEVYPGSNGVNECWKRRGKYDGRYLILSSKLNVCENEVLKMQGVESGTEQFFDLNTTNFHMRFPKCDDSVEYSKYLPYMTMYYTNHHKFCLYRILVATQEYNICALPPSTLTFDKEETCHNKQHKVLIVGIVLSIFYIISVVGLLLVIYHLKRSKKSGDKTAFMNFDELQRNEKNAENNNSKNPPL